MRIRIRPGAAVAILASLFIPDVVLAGSLSTPGQGARALAMGGAFTAVADDASAVYYNPAGITQVPGQEAMIGFAWGAPEIDYRSGGTEYHSTKKWLLPWLFGTRQLGGGLSAGIGLYTPFARDAEYDADPATFFPSQRATIFRTDLSPVLAYRVNPRLSLSGGLVFGYSEVDQSLPAGATSRIEDTMDGWGTGAVFGLLARPSDYLKLGLTWRSRMTTDYEGKRRLLTAAPALSSSAKAEGKWPSSLGLGLALMPTERLTLSADAQWTEWSYVDSITTRTATLGDSTVTLDQRDTWDYRLGAEWEFDPDWYLRGGYGRIARSMPTRWMIPSMPDGTGNSFTIGIGRAGKHWGADVAYEFDTTRTLSASDNAYGYTGDYQIDQHVLALTLSYH